MDLPSERSFVECRVQGIEGRNPEKVAHYFLTKSTRKPSKLVKNFHLRWCTLDTTQLLDLGILQALDHYLVTSVKNVDFGIEELRIVLLIHSPVFFPDVSAHFRPTLRTKFTMKNHHLKLGKISVAIISDIIFILRYCIILRFIEIYNV